MSSQTETPAAVAPEPVTALAGVGPALAEKLERLSVTTVQDLLFLLPIRYEDRTRLVEIGTLRPGVRTSLVGEVELSEVVIRRRRMLLVRVADGTGSLLLRFFYFSRAQAAGLLAFLRKEQVCLNRTLVGFLVAVSGGVLENLTVAFLANGGHSFQRFAHDGVAALEAIQMRYICLL